MKWNLWQTYDNGRGVFRKSYIITENQNKLFDAKLPHWLKSYENENAQHAVMRARWGAVQLENAMPTKHIDIKLADYNIYGIVVYVGCSTGAALAFAERGKPEVLHRS